MSTETVSPVDFVNRTIEIGNTVVYPVRQGSSMWLNKMVVTGIENRDKGYVLVGYIPDHPGKRRVQISSLDRCVVIQ
jgi:hypothetical protein